MTQSNPTPPAPCHPLYDKIIGKTKQNKKKTKNYKTARNKHNFGKPTKENQTITKTTKLTSPTPTPINSEWKVVWLDCLVCLFFPLVFQRLFGFGCFRRFVFFSCFGFPDGFGSFWTRLSCFRANLNLEARLSCFQTNESYGPVCLFLERI